MENEAGRFCNRDIDHAMPKRAWNRSRVVEWKSETAVVSQPLSASGLGIREGKVFAASSSFSAWLFAV